MRSGSKSAAVVPMAASTRPQLGSCPKTAHLKRLLRAIARPTCTASSSEAACSTWMAIVWAAPSASTSSCKARSWQVSSSAAWKSRGVGRTPDAPLLITITVSLVDIQPSLSIRSKLRRQALAN